MSWKVYCDISGSEGDQRRLLVAGGYLARECQWLRWDREWLTALTEYGVGSFHATDFNSARAEFSGWDQRRRVQFSKRLTAITETCLEHGFGWGVRCDEEYDRELGAVLQGIRTLNGRLTPRMYITVTLLAQVARHLRLKERIDCVIERERGSNETAAWLKYLQDQKEPLLSGCYGTIETAPKSACMRLQAADLIAHESWRANGEVLSPQGRPERRSLARLGRRNRLQVVVIKPTGLRSLAKQYQDFLVKHPTGIGRHA